MPTASNIRPCLTKPHIRKITSLFGAVKLTLLLIACITPVQYDSSSKLFLAKGVLSPASAETLASSRPSSPSLVWSTLSHLVDRLAIWDSVYFIAMADRGQIYEQEWAFSKLWSVIIRSLTPSALLNWTESPLNHIYWYAITAIVISNICHYLATLTLYYLTQRMFRGVKAPQLALTTALLYCISPAGMFLVAGYTEAPFALLSFLGLLLRDRQYPILAGVLFAISCGIRGNGLFWGILYLYDLALHLYKYHFKRKIRTVSIILGGSLIGAMFLGIQYYAYRTYCPERQLWCNKPLPLIYSFVQNHYWNLGFLNYWTPNNIPNFAFGLPTFILLCLSLKYFSKHEFSSLYMKLLPLMIIQAITAVSALFLWHFQIITRVATCLPLMYWYVADLMVRRPQSKTPRVIATYFIVWIVVQGILWSAYLPPA
ncbi:mannosyltransferase [Nadsonia fulvescens var. elongata DSM 6958]|uniref:GPI mannosyltransferase 2 n=1 Tax=Nadsonia fulvescens var. elongata DSM 6958 TaxID=857566 RepID=A0A1E3PEQ3_9ASCO|nr:mannosyltransferase [Nadsonia fulvescens var. elongata DSM 6958]